MAACDVPGQSLAVASLTALGAPQRVGPLSWAARTTGELRREFAAVCERALGEDEAAVLPGVVLGDSARVPDALKDVFRDAGLTHLMVVSGANFAVVVGALLLLLRGVGTDPRLAAVLAFAALVGLVLLVRPSPSVLRAAVMGALGLVALFAGRRAQAEHALGVAVIALLAADPALAADYGFVLSVLVTGGLLRVAPRLRKKLAANKVPAVLAEAFAATAAAHVVTAPVAAALTGRMSAAGLFANLVVEPVVGLMTVLGCLGVVVVAEAAGSCPYGVIHTGKGPLGFARASGLVLAVAGVLWLRARRTALSPGGLPHGHSTIHARRASPGGAHLRGTLHRAESAAGLRPRRGHDP